MSQPSSKIKIKALGWMLFSGTAMLSAFILPVHIAALMEGRWMNTESLVFKAYFFILFGAALYHSLYRVWTLAFDFTWVRLAHRLIPVLGLIFVAGMSGVTWQLFFT